MSMSVDESAGQRHHVVRPLSVEMACKSYLTRSAAQSMGKKFLLLLLFLVSPKSDWLQWTSAKDRSVGGYTAPKIRPLVSASSGNLTAWNSFSQHSLRVLRDVLPWQCIMRLSWSEKLPISLGTDSSGMVLMMAI